MCGSIIYKTIQDIRDGRILAPNIKLVTFGGFRTDDPTDQGEDYMGISQREDYISKVQILLSGGLIFPTMSDKKSWNYLRGFVLKGINHMRSYSSASLNKFGEDGSFSQLADVSQ
jgi:hypothetical protein